MLLQRVTNYQKWQHAAGGQHLQHNLHNQDVQEGCAVPQACKRVVLISDLA